MEIKVIRPDLSYVSKCVCCDNRPLRGANIVTLNQEDVATITGWFRALGLNSVSSPGLDYCVFIGVCAEHRYRLNEFLRLVRESGNNLTEELIRQAFQDSPSSD